MAKNFVNPAFREIYEGITGVMPQLTFYGIVVTYLITAALNVYFIPLPLYLSVPAALAIQFGRFSIVFMDFLNPTGRRSPWPPLIATLATIIAISELGFSMFDLGYTDAKFWATFLFGGMVISFGYLLEINFISKGAEAFGMQRRRPGGSDSAPETFSPNTYRQPAAAKTPLFQEEEEQLPFDLFSLNGNGKSH